MYFRHPLSPLSDERRAIVESYHADEAMVIEQRLQQLDFDEVLEQKIQMLARELVVAVREEEQDKSGVEALMAHYDLSNEEGIMLMCLAEALLRVPDKQTEHMLIRDKLTSADWQKHLGLSESSFVNMATWGLALTGKVLKKDQDANVFKRTWQGFLRKSGEPVVRQAVREAIRVMSHQFVLGRTIQEAFKRGEAMEKKGYTFSFDMLGEGARTQADADQYFQAYFNAIVELGKHNQQANLFKAPSISVKLTALYPRYTFEHQEKAVPYLVERVKKLIVQAKSLNVSVTIDAEESYRLGISLDIIEQLFADPEFTAWEGIGLAVQAYQKRAYPVIQYLIHLAEKHNKRIQIRLVKGAYWDSEIKHAQEFGFSDYPVFTRKTSTDVSYLACAKLMLDNPKAIYPQFATHNAYTVAAILNLLDDQLGHVEFEFQHLQGMGKALHDKLVHYKNVDITNRVYAPVGSHEDLLPYLVRRLLENGANSSFVNQITDKDTPIEKLIESPVKYTKTIEPKAHPRIPLPRDIYGDQRRNSMGVDFTDHNELAALSQQMESFKEKQYFAGIKGSKTVNAVTSPFDRRQVVGQVAQADEAQMEQALLNADQAFSAWDQLGVAARADLLQRVADLLEENRAEIMSLIGREAGRNMPDTLSEVREAADFCRYYALQANETLQPLELTGYTGETDTLRMHGRGTVLCISPWNFPAAIFTGQISAALVAGNCVIAKPAGPTPLIAQFIVDLFHQVGVPKAVLQCVPCSGRVANEVFVADERIKAVIFTGSTSVAKTIQRTLANREGPIVPLVAETGGINAMIADSTALPEQLVDDVLLSAFGSAGQRCSALRVLFVQEDIADKVITMLQGAMQELTLGIPFMLATDVGPVIDASALSTLQAHVTEMKQRAKLIYEVPLPLDCHQGTFMSPAAFELPDLSYLQKEVFGPVLHVIRYAKKDLDKVIQQINALNFGLTFGIQSRVDEFVDYVQQRINAGNIYVNRNIIGAVVGLQPFGGSQLSGTGPKAGGPHYLLRLCRESTLTINTTAAGGNASLMSLD